MFWYHPHVISDESLALWEHARHVSVSGHHCMICSPHSVWHVARVTGDWVFCLRLPHPAPPVTSRPRPSGPMFWPAASPAVSQAPHGSAQAVPVLWLVHAGPGSLSSGQHTDTLCWPAPSDSPHNVGTSWSGPGLSSVSRSHQILSLLGLDRFGQDREEDTALLSFHWTLFLHLRFCQEKLCTFIKTRNFLRRNET